MRQFVGKVIPLLNRLCYTMQALCVQNDAYRPAATLCLITRHSNILIKFTYSTLSHSSPFTSSGATRSPLI